MVEAGDIFENPASGQRLIFRKTARDTAGKLLEVESVYTKPTPFRPPVHCHPRQEERFEVLSGEVRAVVGGEERTLREGEVMIIAAGVPHEMWAEEAGVRVNWQTRPALETEAFFETLWGLARDGKTNARGVPNLLRVAMIAREYDQEFRLTRPPRAVQRAVFGPLAPLGRLLGYPARYPYPSAGPESPAGSERSTVASGATMIGIPVAAVLGFLALLLLWRRKRRTWV